MMRNRGWRVRSLHYGREIGTPRSITSDGSHRTTRRIAPCSERGVNRTVLCLAGGRFGASANMKYRRQLLAIFCGYPSATGLSRICGTPGNFAGIPAGFSVRGRARHLIQPTVVGNKPSWEFLFPSGPRQTETPALPFLLDVLNQASDMQPRSGQSDSTN